MSREALARAIKSRDAAAVIVKDAATLLDAAETFAARLKADVDRFVMTDKAVAAERAEKIRAALAEGSEPDLRPSDDLAEAVAAKAEAENKLSAARATVAACKADLDAARQDLAEAEDAVSKAVGAVVAEEARRQSDAIAAIEAEAVAMRAALHGAVDVRIQIAGRTSEVAFDPAVFETWRMSHKTEIGTTNAPAWHAAKSSISTWNAWARALMTNPNAEIR